MNDHQAPSTIPKERPQSNVTSLLELSTKKQFKMPHSTPSKPSPLSGRVLNSNRLETPSGDIKPLKSLGVISGLQTLSKPSSIASSHLHRNDTGASNNDEMKPKWAQLLESSTDIKPSHSSRDPNQDITELLSPRKKRKGWVPAGYAERSAAIIKRLQTGSNLWIHEISRTLTTFSNNNNTSASSSKVVKKENIAERSLVDRDMTSNKKTYESLAIDLNPHLRLEILEILSPKPASLTWSSQDGGFITAGAAEKLLITRCRILKDEDDEEAGIQGSNSNSKGEQSTHTKTTDEPSSWEDQVEGMVIFSLTAHSRTSTGISLARKEQHRPSRDFPPTSESNNDPHQHSNQDRNQSRLDFKQDNKKKWNVFIPASIADLHTQIRVNDEIWIWEPWSVVDLLPELQTRSSKCLLRDNTLEQETERFGEMEKTNEKALLVSRFAVLL